MKFNPQELKKAIDEAVDDFYTVHPKYRTKRRLKTHILETIEKQDSENESQDIMKEQL